MSTTVNSFMGKNRRRSQAGRPSAAATAAFRRGLKNHCLCSPEVWAGEKRTGVLPLVVPRRKFWDVLAFSYNCQEPRHEAQSQSCSRVSRWCSRCKSSSRAYAAPRSYRVPVSSWARCHSLFNRCSNSSTNVILSSASFALN
jgi:hypothetical protein